MYIINEIRNLRRSIFTSETRQQIAPNNLTPWIILNSSYLLSNLTVDRVVLESGSVAGRRIVNVPSCREIFNNDFEDKGLSYATSTLLVDIKLSNGVEIFK